MVCIYCRSSTQVTNSRLQTKSNKVWRRRYCENCGNVFTTIEAAKDLYVQDDMSSTAKAIIRPFSRDKLFISIYSSCGHRKASLDDASALTDTVVDKLLGLMRDGCIPKTEILSITYSVLDRFDKTASMYFEAYFMKD